MEFISCVILIFTTFFIISISGSLLFRQKQNLPPSPSAIPIIGHLHLLKKPLHRTLQSLSLQLGPILFLKLGFRNVLVVSSPSLVEEIFTKHDIHFANRPNLLVGKHLGHNYTYLVWVPYGHHWRTLRRITSIQLVSSGRLLFSAPLRREEIHRSVQQMLGEFSFSSPSTRNEWKVIDLRSTFFDLMVNIVMRLVTGEPYFGDEMESGEKTRRREFLRETFVPNMAMNLGDMFMVLRKFSCLGFEKKLAKLQEARVEFLNGLIYEGRKKMTSEEPDGGEKEKKKRMTLIDGLLALQKTEPDSYADDMLQGLISIMFIAGTDTSSTTMEWTMSLLLNHPEVLEKAREEIDANVRDGRLMDDSDLSNLPYLHCIINESLRLFPVAPLLNPRCSLEECILGGYRVPRGTMLLVNAWALHRDPKVWEEPNSFKPKRMKRVQGENDRYKFIPFGFGRRVCPGAEMATRTMALALGTLIQCFEWKRTGPDLIDLAEGSGTTIPMAKPLVGMYRPRECLMNTLSQPGNHKS